MSPRRRIPSPDRVVTVRALVRGRPGPAILATTDPAVLAAVERAIGRRLAVDDASPKDSDPADTASEQGRKS